MNQNGHTSTTLVVGGTGKTGRRVAERRTPVVFIRRDDRVRAIGGDSGGGIGMRAEAGEHGVGSGEP